MIVVTPKNVAGVGRVGEVGRTPETRIEVHVTIVKSFGRPNEIKVSSLRKSGTDLNLTDRIGPGLHRKFPEP